MNQAEQNAADVQLPDVPFAVPDEIDSDTLAELQGMAPPRKSEEPKIIPSESDDQIEELESEARKAGNPQMPNTEQLMHMVNALVEARLGGKKEEEAAVDVIEQITSSGVDREGAQFMVDNVRKILNADVGNRLTSMEKKLENLGRFAARSQQERVVGSYQSHLDSLMDNASITDPVQREMYRETVTARGMRKYGEQFDLDRASQVFRQLRNETISRSHKNQERHVEDSKRAMDDSPPVRNSTSTGSGNMTPAAQLRQRLKDPKDKQMNFRSGDFQKFVGAFARGLMGDAPR